MTALVWAAGKDGIAHAARRGHARTFCGLKAEGQRWAWPEQSRCGDCQALEVWPSIRRREPRQAA
jgi:hypothetical protein